MTFLNCAAQLQHSTGRWCWDIPMQLLQTTFPFQEPWKPCFSQISLSLNQQVVTNVLLNLNPNPNPLVFVFFPSKLYDLKCIVTFSEDHVTLTLLMHGTHTCNRAGNAMKTEEMNPSKPPKRFESTIVFTFSFNNRGRISKISKVFDITDMYQQLNWCSLDSSNGELFYDLYSKE